MKLTLILLVTTVVASPASLELRQADICGSDAYQAYCCIKGRMPSLFNCNQVPPGTFSTVDEFIEFYENARADPKCCMGVMGMAFMCTDPPDGGGAF